MTDGQSEILDDCRAAEKHSVVFTNGGNKIMPKGRLLDKATIQKFIEDREAGDSPATIAGRYGVSVQTVRNKTRDNFQNQTSPHSLPNSLQPTEPWLLDKDRRWALLMKIMYAELAEILRQNPTMDEAEAAAEWITQKVHGAALAQATLLAGERNRDPL